MKRGPRPRRRERNPERIQAALAKIRGVLEHNPEIAERTRDYFLGELPAGRKAVSR